MIGARYLFQLVQTRCNSNAWTELQMFSTEATNVVSPDIKKRTYTEKTLICVIQLNLWSETVAICNSIVQQLYFIYHYC